MSDQTGDLPGKDPGPLLPSLRISCPYLNASVELSEERERHVAERHPDLLPQHRNLVIDAVREPDQVRTSSRFVGATLFSRWYTDLRGGKHVVVVVVSSDSPHERHWIITAYLARRLSEGNIVWTRG